MKILIIRMLLKNFLHDRTHSICYPDYFRIYDISTTKAKSNYLGRDQLGYWVNSRKSPLRIQDTERFFYQQLLL
jgi:hypothetical protein